MICCNILVIVAERVAALLQNPPISSENLAFIQKYVAAYESLCLAGNWSADDAAYLADTYNAAAEVLV